MIVWIKVKSKWLKTSIRVSMKSKRNNRIITKRKLETMNCPICTTWIATNRTTKSMRMTIPWTFPNRKSLERVQAWKFLNPKPILIIRIWTMIHSSLTRKCQSASPLRKYKSYQCHLDPIFLLSLEVPTEETSLPRSFIGNSKNRLKSRKQPIQPTLIMDRVPRYSNAHKWKPVRHRDLVMKRMILIKTPKCRCSKVNIHLILNSCEGKCSRFRNQ